MNQLCLLCLSISCLVPLYSSAETSPLPKTVVSDCMVDGESVLSGIKRNSKVFEDAVGKVRAAKLYEELIADLRKDEAKCAARTPAEKTEIERKYEQEYGYKRQPPPVYGDGALFPLGSILNPIQVQIIPMR